MNNSCLFIRQNWNLVKRQKRLLGNKKRLAKEELKMKVLQEKYLEKVGV
ncbi:MAG: hypothetical protein PHV52_00025 [Aliarcobacter sp.]|nr:hypothetical protein [Aliarcobacter sp.]